MAEEKIKLADLVQQLRTELVEATKAGKDQAIRFELTGVRLETQVVVSRETEDRGRLKFWVLDAALAQKEHGSTIHKIVLDLNPKDPSQRNIQLTEKL